MIIYTFDLLYEKGRWICYLYDSLVLYGVGGAFVLRGRVVV